MEDPISFATSYENFLKLLELKGYEIKRQAGATYLKPMGEKRVIRLTDGAGILEQPDKPCVLPAWAVAGLL